MVLELAADESGREVVAGRLRSVVAGEPDGFAGVVSLLSLASGRDGVFGSVPVSVALTLGLVQALGDAGVEARLWCVTRNAVAVSGSERVRDLDQSQVWGLGRVAGLELGARWGGVVDLPEVVDARLVGCLAGVFASGEGEVAVRAAGVFGRRVIRAAGVAGGGSWRVWGTVLVTGGTGGLGRRVARWLVGAGAEHVVLASRRGAEAAGVGELKAEFAAAGVGLSVVACDMGDRSAVEALLAGVPVGLPLTAVVHAAGVLDDGVLDGLSVDRFEPVLRAKAEGARHLHELTRGMDLSAFVLFSSFSATVGGAGQANYAAANAYLDALAEARRGEGLPATSIAWGP
ncbi:beta-ketoacyl reductase, partial [Streptomyces sp. NPDC032940]|uniref:beta-ketoacyl reductase n=1 Tax=Streptomyces sp. NPDC032940 TaxID=3155366 RepID=UPI0033F34628